MKTDPIILTNGRVRVTTLHTSKRGKVYKRRHIELSTTPRPSWFKNAMARLRWFK